MRLYFTLVVNQVFLPFKQHPNMKNAFFAAFLLASVSVHAQYYYSDIVGTREIADKMKTFTAAKVKSVTATGYDGNGVRSADFNEWQEVTDNGMGLKITTRNGYTKSTTQYRFDGKGKLVGTTDENEGTKNTSTYSYDGEGRLLRIENVTSDSANEFNEKEIHQWVYDGTGKPTTMWRILNGDSTEVRFTQDSAGNITDEELYKRKAKMDHIYYYYDDQHRLTDVVRFNAKLQKMLPDYMFEYDDANRVIQKITTLSSLNLGYLIWRYIFDAKNGLKTKEALFNKQKQLTGKIDYQYTFNP